MSFLDALFLAKMCCYGDKADIWCWCFIKKETRIEREEKIDWIEKNRKKKPWQTCSSLNHKCQNMSKGFYLKKIKNNTVHHSIVIFLISHALQGCIYLIKKYSNTVISNIFFFQFEYVLKCNLFLWCKAKFSASLLQSSVSQWSFRNHMLICCSRNISYCHQCRNQLRKMWNSFHNFWWFYHDFQDHDLKQKSFITL